MSQTPSCPKCGAPLADDAPAGLCPKCLVQAGFESESPPRPEPAPTAASPSSSGFKPPEVEELAKRFPQLEILELLGKGGMGAVYKARQPGLDRLVAIKILPVETSHDPTFAERFTREARALARLSHPNIVAIYDFGQTEGLYFFVMEYVDGVNLRQAMQAGGMTPQNALTIVRQICDALQFAHDEGIVHRDIKPENILIDKRGRVKIADFGLAKLLGQESVDHGLTAPQQVMGTLRYMAPEQMEGKKSVDHRADIYSLGVVFYELLTGELPIGRFAPPSKQVEIDVRLDEVVLRALEKEPEQRYQHASEVKTDMESITGSTGGSSAATFGGASSGPTLLLDETDRAARRHQHFLLLGGMAWIEPKAAQSAVSLANGPNQVNPIGRISLWMAIGGLVVPTLLALIKAEPENSMLPPKIYFFLCLAVLFLLESAAFGCGFVGRRMTSGKAAIAISVISFVLVGLLLVSIDRWSLGPWMTHDVGVKTVSPTVHETADRAAAVQPKTMSAIATPPVQNAPVGKQVPPTPVELAHILSELPEEFTNGLQGSDVEKIRELDTFVRAIDFDDGPADFWMQAYEFNQPKSFPERLPSRSEWDVWRIPKAKVHILMWIQPRQSVGMSDQPRGALAAMPPGCSLGIDVDGKKAARINYDVPKRNPRMQPLWFDWDSREMPEPDRSFASEIHGRVISFIVRSTGVGEWIPHSCQLALVYRRATSDGESPQGNKQ